MSGTEIAPLPLTSERFALFGEVIAASPTAHHPMNEARFERFDNLARVDVVSGRLNVSVARCRTPTALPYRFDMVERHPLGSQAFVPLNGQRFVVVVAPPGESVEIESLCAFVTNGHQGVNYHAGTWHMPLIALEAGQEFLVLDRAGEGANCDQVILSERVTLLAP